MRAALLLAALLAACDDPAYDVCAPASVCPGAVATRVGNVLRCECPDGGVVEVPLTWTYCLEAAEQWRGCR